MSNKALVLRKTKSWSQTQKKYEGTKFIYKKEMPTEEQVPKEKDEIAGTESKEEGMSNSSEMEGKNKQEKREVSMNRKKGKRIEMEI